MWEDAPERPTPDIPAFLRHPRRPAHAPIRPEPPFRNPYHNPYYDRPQYGRQQYREPEFYEVPVRPDPHYRPEPRYAPDPYEEAPFYPYPPRRRRRR